MPLNVINYTPLVEEDGTVTPLNRIVGTIQFGQAWYKDIQAQETVISRLRKLLSDRFTLVRNFSLPEEDIPIPILLVSGGGIWVMMVTDAAGIYKTGGSDLMELDTKTQEFVPSQNNLVMRTVLLARAFEEFLHKNQIPIQGVEPVLIFTNPGVDVTTGDSKVRVVLFDALNRFATSLLSIPTRLEVGTSKRIVDLIKDSHSKAQEKTPEKSSGINLKFTTTQWIVIGAMTVILILSCMLLIAMLLSF